MAQGARRAHNQALIEAEWKEWFHPEILPPPGHFKREKRIYL